MLKRARKYPKMFCDAVGPNADPTGTFDLRRRFTSMATMRWRKLRAILQQTIVNQDVLGLKPTTVSVLQVVTSLQQKQHANGAGMAHMPIDSKVLVVQTWTDDLLKRTIVDDGQWLRPMIEQSYRRAVARAIRLTGNSVQPLHQSATINALTQLAIIELQGICEAVSQQTVRASSNGLIERNTPQQVFRIIDNTLTKVGISRTTAMIDLMVVKAFSTGTLDQFELAGVTLVKPLPEHVPALRTDARFEDAPRRTGPGSRISRTQAPSRRTVGRIREVQQTLERRFGTRMVGVETANDDRVCPVCEGIADEGPYTINEARSLIPAHPRCRCAFTNFREEDYEE